MQDVRLALRVIAGNRWFSAAVIATLALGIGLNTTVFTLVNAVLFKAVPVPDGERLVTLATRHQNGGPNNLSRPDFLDYRSQASSFETLQAAEIAGNGTISEPGRPAERVRLARLTAGFFEMVRTAPILGRGFTAADEQPGAPLVVVLGHSVWTTRYDSAADVIGRTVRVNEEPATIVGVMPDGFGLPDREALWTPLIPDEDARRRDHRSLLVIGLLARGVRIDDAQAELDVIAARLEAEHPDTNRGTRMVAETFHDRFNGGEVQVVFLAMLGAVALLLLVACANVANMMLGRALGRHREMSVRLALGASRGRLVRQMLVETLLLGAAGAVIGLGVTVAGTRAFDAAVANSGKPSWIVFSVDWGVLAYTAVITVAAAIACGLLPALRASQADTAGALKTGGRSGTAGAGRLAGALVVAQVTCALVLIAAAALLVRSLVASQVVNGTMPRQQVMTARVELPADRYPDVEARVRFYDEALRQLHAAPGVRTAAVLANVPGLGAEQRIIEPQGAPAGDAERPRESYVVPASPGYFALLDLALVQGRAFDDRDGMPGSEVAVVSAEFARRYWPGESAVGKRLRFGGDTPGPWLTVVGVSADLVQTQRRGTPDRVVFVPHRQEASLGPLLLAVRTSGDATSFAGLLRETVRRLDPDLPLFEVRTFQGAVQDSRVFFRVFAGVFSIFGLVALAMAALGLYAVMAQTTARRTREIGIRMALGATPAGILRTVMRRGVVQLAIGLMVGLGLALAATSTLQSLLFSVAPTDPVSFATASFVLVLVGLAACALPAWRAARISPVEALANE